MSGTSLLADTNIVLYLLGGDKTLAAMLNNTEVYVSYITEMELLSYKNLSTGEENRINAFLKDAIVIEMTFSIKQKAIEIRRATGMKLPDSISAASCLQMDLPLLTADGGFKKVKSLNYLHYEK